MMMTKKKTAFLLVMVLVLSMAMITGCGGNSDDSGDAGADSAGTNANYLEWSAEEWNAASDAEKTEAIKAVLVEIQPELEGQDQVLEQSAGSLIQSMEILFEQAPDSTLGDIVKQAQGATTTTE